MIRQLFLDTLYRIVLALDGDLRKQKIAAVQAAVGRKQKIAANAQLWNCS